MTPTANQIREAAKFASVTSAEQDTLRTAALLFAELLEGGTLVKFDLPTPPGYRRAPSNIVDMENCDFDD